MTKFPRERLMAFAGRRCNEDLKQVIVLYALDDNQKLSFKNSKLKATIGQVYSLTQLSENKYSIPQTRSGWDARIVPNKTDSRADEWVLEDKASFINMKAHQESIKKLDKLLKKHLEPIQKARWNMPANQRVAFDVWILSEISKMPKQG